MRILDLRACPYCVITWPWRFHAFHVKAGVHYHVDPLAEGPGKARDFKFCTSLHDVGWCCAKDPLGDLTSLIAEVRTDFHGIRTPTLIPKISTVRCVEAGMRDREL